MEKVLEVSNLTKLYRNKRGISDITFEVAKGEVFGLLGPNGAGKTTVMKTVTGLCRADQGTVRIFGYDISKAFEKAMKKVGCIIENPEAYEYMSAYGNLELALRLYKGLGKDRIDEVLELVGLSKFKHEKVGNYSLGMKQRLGLAAALLAQPELVILDEPGNGLDIEGMVDIRSIIKGLAKEQGITFVVSSHLIHEIELTCSRVGIIDGGRLIDTGSVAELLLRYDTLENYFIERVRSKRLEAI